MSAEAIAKGRGSRRPCVSLTSRSIRDEVEVASQPSQYQMVSMCIGGDFSQARGVHGVSRRTPPEAIFRVRCGCHTGGVGSSQRSPLLFVL